MERKKKKENQWWRLHERDVVRGGTVEVTEKAGSEKRVISQAALSPGESGKRG